METPKNTNLIVDLLKKLSTRPIIVAVLLFIALNYLVMHKVGANHVSEILTNQNAVPLSQTFTGWTAKAYLKQKSAPDIVLMGSSQMGCAVFCSDAHRLQQALDCVIHREGSTLALNLQEKLGQPIKVFNWALGGSMISDAYMESLALFNGDLKPKLIVIGIAPRDFIDASLQYAGSTEEFHFFTRYVDPGKMTGAAFPDLFARGDWLINEKMPLRKIGKKWQKVPQEVSSSTKGGQKALQAISATGADVTPGQWVIPANMPAIFENNTDEYLHRFRNPKTPLYGQEFKFFNAFLEMMNDKGIKVVVVGMPSLSPNRALLTNSFWSKWRNDVAIACTNNHASWLDLTDSKAFNIDDFLDTVHMNAAGGAKFFSILTQYLLDHQDIVMCLRPAVHLKFGVAEYPASHNF